MANTDIPKGFRPVGHLLGCDWSEKVQWFVHPASDSAAIGLYDFVAPSSAGAEATGMFPICVAATTSSGTLLGAAVAFQTDSPVGLFTTLAAPATTPRVEYAAASTLCYVGVTTDPFVIYEAQEDGNAGVGTVGNLFHIVPTVASTTTGLSQQEIDSSTARTTNNAAAGAVVEVLKVLNLAPRETTPSVDGNTVGTNAKWRCIINEHFYKGTVGA